MNEAQLILPRLKRLAELEKAHAILQQTSAARLPLSAEIEMVRALLPTSILLHHDSRLRRGKPILAPVTDGVCGACHLAIPRGRAADLLKIRNDLNVCDNCGVFIYLAEEPKPPSAIPRKRPIAGVKKAGPPKRVFRNVNSQKPTVAR